jgi:hypothetical protein
MFEKTRTLFAPAAALTALLTVLCVALPAAAQTLEMDRADEPEKIIGLKARVTPFEGGPSTDYDIQPGVTVPMYEGERLRLRMVGTALVDGRGVEREIQARLELGAGSRWIDVEQAGSQGVVVISKPIPPGAADGGSVSAQVAFTVTGNYDVRRNLQTGRVTFDIQPTRAVAATDLASDERWQLSEDVAGSLMAILLDDAGDPLDYQVKRIYAKGHQGAKDMAIVLAQQAERRGSTRGWQPTEIVGHLYRELLGRDGSDREIRLSDPGFDNNVRLYERNGYQVLVQTLVDADEFVRHHDLRRLEELYIDPDVAGQEVETPQPDGARRTRPRGWGGR